MKLFNNKGQGSFLGGDIPSIIMIVISIMFFITSVYTSIEHFDSSKEQLRLEAALVDSASAFLKENAKIRPSDLDQGSEVSFWSLRLDALQKSYGVNIYVELESLRSGEVWKTDNPPGEEIQEILSKRFPIAVKAGTTDLDIDPALIKVVVYIA